MMGRANIIPKSDSFFLPSQKRWIEDKSPFKIFEKGRQLGISLSTAYSSVMKTAPSDSTANTWIVSRDELAAKLFLKDCKRFSDILQIVCDDVNSSIIQDEKRPSSFSVKYLNDKTITCLSSNINSLASKRGSVVIDEFALHIDQEELLAIAKPVTTWSGTMELISTHRGYNTIFNQLIREIRDNGNPKNISLHSYTLQDALKEGFLFKLQSKLLENNPIQDMNEEEYFDYIKNQSLSESLFLREYMCVPDQDSDNFFPAKLVAKCMNTPEGYVPRGIVYIGIDFGRTNDNTVIWVLDKFNGEYFTVEVQVLKQMEFSLQETIISGIIERYNPQQVGCDNKGIGMNITENLGKVFHNKITAINSTAHSKEVNAYSVKKKLEDGILHLPNDNTIITDFSLISKVVTASTTRFESKRDSTGHGDRFHALTYALEVAEAKKSIYFTPISV